MAQLSPDRYKRLTRGHEYGVSDGLYWDVTNSEMVVVIDDTVKGKFPLSQTSGHIMASDGTDLEPGAAVVGASALTANLKTGYIPLDIFTARIISANAIQNTTEAGIPDGNTSPSIARVNGATDKQGRLIWAAGDATEIQFRPFVYPADLDDTAAVVVKLLAAMSNTNDTPTIAVGYFEGIGDTNAGGNTGAVTGTTPAVYSVSVAAADIAAAPQAASVSLTPAAHATDAIHLYGAWIEYTRKS